MKIGTLNLCLGLKNKKDEVEKLIKEKKLDILRVQETELEKDYSTDILTFNGYNYESDINEKKLVLEYTYQIKSHTLEKLKEKEQTHTKL